LPSQLLAAPHLSGVAAWVLSLRPELKPFEMKTILYWICQARAPGPNGTANAWATTPVAPAAADG
jgi:hypothetical protein